MKFCTCPEDYKHGTMNLVVCNECSLPISNQPTKDDFDKAIELLKKSSKRLEMNSQTTYSEEINDFLNSLK
jgi:hypothetical protein